VNGEEKRNLWATTGDGGRRRRRRREGELRLKIDRITPTMERTPAALVVRSRYSHNTTMCTVFPYMVTAVGQTNRTACRWLGSHSPPFLPVYVFITPAELADHMLRPVISPDSQHHVPPPLSPLPPCRSAKVSNLLLHICNVDCAHAHHPSNLPISNRPYRNRIPRCDRCSQVSICIRLASMHVFPSPLHVSDGALLTANDPSLPMMLFSTVPRGNVP
jgi:hypothetical protein